jgi:hypothetical protein
MSTIPIPDPNPLPTPDTPFPDPLPFPSPPSPGPFFQVPPVEIPSQPFDPPEGPEGATPEDFPEEPEVVPDLADAGSDADVGGDIEEDPGTGDDGG